MKLFINKNSSDCIRTVVCIWKSICEIIRQITSKIKTICEIIRCFCRESTVFTKNEILHNRHINLLVYYFFTGHKQRRLAYKFNIGSTRVTLAFHDLATTEVKKKDPPLSESCLILP